MKKVIAAALMTGVALLGVGTANAAPYDTHSWSYAKGQKLAPAAARMAAGGMMSAEDACLQVVGSLVMNRDPDVFQRSDWSQADTIYGCLNSI